MKTIALMLTAAMIVFSYSAHAGFTLVCDEIDLSANSTKLISLSVVNSDGNLISGKIEETGGTGILPESVTFKGKAGRFEVELPFDLEKASNVKGYTMLKVTDQIADVVVCTISVKIGQADLPEGSEIEIEIENDGLYNLDEVEKLIFSGEAGEKKIIQVGAQGESVDYRVRIEWEKTGKSASSVFKVSPKRLKGRKGTIEVVYLAKKRFVGEKAELIVVDAKGKLIKKIELSVER